MAAVDRIKDALESDTPGRVEWRTQLETALFEIERLQARLDMIADIAEGSTTANSLPHIAKIARGVEQEADGK